MKPVGITSFQGPNIHSKQAVVRLAVELESLWSLPANELRRRIAERLPDTPNWQVLRVGLERLAAEAEEVSWAIAAAYLTRDLQNERFGEPLAIWSEDGRVAGSRDFLIAIVDPDIGEMAARFAYRITHHLYIDPENTTPSQQRQTLTLAEQSFRRRRQVRGYLNDTEILLAAARARGVPVCKLLRGWRYAMLGHGTRRVRVGQNASDLTSALASKISNDKQETWRVLHRIGLPVPKQRAVADEREIEAAVRDIGFPLVVKAATGSKGASVTANIQHLGEMAAAVTKARRHDSRILVEQHIDGTDYRLLIVNGRMVAAGRRRPGHVVGDGQKSVRELVEHENMRRFSRGGYAFLLVPLALDEEALALLARQGLASDSIPVRGREVALRSTGNISQGALPEDVTEEVHPDTVAKAVHAVRAIGLDIGGVDVLTTDIARPLAETGGVIVEINHFPGVGVHYATETPPRDVAGAIIDYLFPAPARGRIPLVAVTGTNGKTTTCRMLQRVFTEAGYCTGLTTTSGSYVNDERLLKGDYANAAGAHSVLQDPRVEAAVLETARGGILKKGLGWDSCDVAIVTNISEDHLGREGIDSLERMAEVKGMIVELARTAVVLNADDPLCRTMAARASAPVWWFTSQPKNKLLEEHLRAGGDAVVLEGAAEDERLVHYAGAQHRDIVRIADMPASLNGLARHNVENALAASAAALAVDLPLEHVVKALAGFTLSFDDSPGRLNIHDVGGARIVIDYPHTVDGISRMGRLLEQMPVGGRRLCVMAISTRQFPEAMDRLAEAAAPFFDCIIVAGSFRHGVERSVEDTAHLMGESLLKAGFAQEAILVEPDEHRAVDRALELIRPGDLLLLLVGRHHEAAWRKVQQLRLATTFAETDSVEPDPSERRDFGRDQPMQPEATVS